MLAYLRQLPSQTARSWSISYHRSISSARVLRQAVRSSDEIEEGEDADEEFDEEEGDFEEGDEGGSGSDRGYEKWLKTEAVSYRDPQPRNWLLGGEGPFPLNKTFKPPIPLSDALRTRIFKEYTADPETNGVRELSARYGLSLKRVDAILRLKGLENHWIKNKPLQSGFLVGMQHLLGVQQTRDEGSETQNFDRIDVYEADALDEVEGDDRARERYQRMFWESVPEGREPIMSANLEQARDDAAKANKAAEDAKSDPVLLGIPKHQLHRRSKNVKGDIEPERKARMLRDRYEVLFYEPKVVRDDLLRLERERQGEDPWLVSSAKNVVIVRSGAAGNRPLIKFEDVGGKFLDVNDRVRRMKESVRRSKIKGKKREKLKEVLKAVHTA